MPKIVIECGDIRVAAELNDGETSREIVSKLPIEGSVNRWGEEIYFSIPVSRGLEDGARADMEVGEIGYWPAGEAFCVFFGPTPASSGDKPVAASEVTVLGKTADDARALSATKNGDKVTIKAG